MEEIGAMMDQLKTSNAKSASIVLRNEIGGRPRLVMISVGSGDSTFREMESLLNVIKEADANAANAANDANDANAAAAEQQKKAKIACIDIKIPIVFILVVGFVAYKLYMRL